MILHKQPPDIYKEALYTSQNHNSLLTNKNVVEPINLQCSVRSHRNIEMRVPNYVSVNHSNDYDQQSNSYISRSRHKFDYY